MRVGLGVDAHAFDDTRALVLGGVRIPDFSGLAGHSDGDVLSHAVADALLSASGISDLGTSFPNTERWKDASSLDILRETAGLIAEADWAIDNVDATLVAQRPHLAPYRTLIIAALAEALSVEETSVWVKATTTDGMGFTGRAEGVAALAVVLIERTRVS
ncbi:MAG TPA: 2-C-methyl-D-erythritol 2,4-cyclodiphosphate synthase [Actinomycetota bacterium]|nr:2-C-methyl-D-erythritol 2,4-cyclodiphosphate synthase [Actinomycetota bacterium]